MTPLQLTKLINLFNCISKDETRRYLCGVNLKKMNEQTWECCATDGHVLSMFELVDDELGPALGIPEQQTDLFIEAQHLPMLKLILKNYRKATHVPLDELKPLILTDKYPCGSFPNYRGIIPDSRKHNYVVTLNLEFLRKIVNGLEYVGLNERPDPEKDAKEEAAKIKARIRDKKNTVTLYFGNSNTDLILIENEEGTGLLCPMRGTKTRTGKERSL